jgi:hypothetical protein
MTETVSVAKPFSWSYSRLKGFETCPRQFYETQVLKDKWPEPRSENLSFGDAVHAAMAEALRTGKPLPLAHKAYQHWIDKVARTPGEMLVESECRWALTRELVPTTWFSDKTWLRSVADVVKVDLNEPATALVVDWKTGKSINVDPMQLTLTALMCFAQFPELLRVRADFVWLQEDSQTTQVIDKPEVAGLWADILPRVERFRKAMELEHFPPQPNRLCKRWCAVRDCEYWGK